MLAARQYAKDRKEWRALVHMWLKVSCGYFAWPGVLSDRPPMFCGWLSPGEGRDAIT